MLTLKPIGDELRWEKFLLASDQVNFLQSWRYGEMQKSLGRQVIRLGIFNNSRLEGIVQLIQVIAKRATYFECPGGPVMAWTKENVKFANRELRILAESHRASFIRMRPNVLATPENLNLVKKNGWRRAPMHLTAETTWVLPLLPSEEEIFRNMRKTTRYLVKKAEKLGVKISQSTDERDIKTLYKLQQETVDRKHFVPFSEEFFLSEFRAFLPDNIRLFKAEYQGKILALAMILFYGTEAVYHYSGSSNFHREVPASYLLQWEVIREAKRRGLSRYNFWGFSDNPKHRFYGPSLFKRGFGGHEVKYMPAQDIVVSPAYWLDWGFETLRRIYRHL